MAATNCSLGDAVGNAHNYKEALLYYRKSEKEYLSQHDTVNALVQQMSIAGTLGNMDMIDSSLFYSERMLPVAIQLKDENLIHKIECNLGGVYMGKGEYKKALSYIKKSLPYFEKNAPPWDLNIAYYSVTTCYTALKEFDSAQKYGLKNYKMTEEQGNIDGIISSGKYLADVYLKMGKYKDAASLYRSTLTRSDSMYDINTTKQVAEMQTKYETEKKDEQLKLQQAELSRQRLVIYGSIAFAAFVILVLIILFINYRKIDKLSKKLAIQTEELQELNHVKDKLFSIISHDLRSPLGSLKNMSTLLKTGSISQEKVNEFSSRMDITLENTINLMDNLLHWATLQIKGKSIREEKLNLEELAEEAVNNIRQDTEDKGIAVKIDIDFEHEVFADENKLLLVIRNLLTNAVKFTPSGGSISVHSQKEGERIRISVTDTGVGMNESTLHDLRSGGAGVTTKGTGQEKGYGLGLQLCKEYAQKWGDELHIESKQGEGSSFSFSLKAA